VFCVVCKIDPRGENEYEFSKGVFELFKEPGYGPQVHIKLDFAGQINSTGRIMTLVVSGDAWALSGIQAKKSVINGTGGLQSGRINVLNSKFAYRHCDKRQCC
jgi:hypothetical protein